MKRFIVTLTAEERRQLETHRSDLGMRSCADVIRHWIAGPLEGIAPQPSRTKGVRDASKLN